MNGYPCFLSLTKAVCSAHLHLMFLDLNEGLAGVLVDGGEEQQQLLHSLLRLQVEGDEAGVEESLHQQPVLNAGHVVAVQDLVLDPGLAIKNPPKKTTKNIFLGVFLKFLFFMKIIQTFLFETDFL